MMNFSCDDYATKEKYMVWCLCSQIEAGNIPGYHHFFCIWQSESSGLHVLIDTYKDIQYVPDSRASINPDWVSADFAMRG